MLAARNLFLQQGYGITSMDLIALKADVTKQTIYRYFSSKEALFVAVMENIRQTETTSYTFSSGSVYEELLSYGQYLLAFHLQPDALGLYRLMLTEGGHENLMKVFMKTGPKKVHQALTGFLQQHYPNLSEVEFCTQMFISMALAPRNHLLMNNQNKLKKSAQKEHIEKVTQLFIKMLES